MDFFNTNTTDAGGNLTEKALRQAWDALWGQRYDAPPRLARVYASHSVPFGRVYRMWTTRGELIAYVNRGEIADLPRAPEPFDFAVVSPLCPPGIIGIPIYFE